MSVLSSIIPSSSLFWFTVLPQGLLASKLAAIIAAPDRVLAIRCDRIMDSSALLDLCDILCSKKQEPNTGENYAFMDKKNLRQKRELCVSLRGNNA